MDRLIDRNDVLPFYIIGNNHFAIMARRYFEQFCKYKVIAYAVEDNVKDCDMFDGLHNLRLSQLTPHCLVFVAIGYNLNNTDRQRVFEKCRATGMTFAKFRHPNTTMPMNVAIRDNVFIFEQNNVQMGVQIGENTILWSGNHIGHASTIGCNGFISSHVCIGGNVSIGNNVFIGMNATIQDGLTIGNHVVIGSAANVCKSVYSNTAVVGNPAHEI
jgi:sugar O-acyltransferase (sialic acid O-acetyltransferase NeuD family)